VHEAGGVVTGLDGAKLAFNRPEPRHGYIERLACSARWWKF
jgi:hypothetical protein